MKVAVLGLGSAGARHARILLDLEHEVVAFDPGPVPTPEGVNRKDSLAEAIQCAESVVVTSPNSLHAAQAVAALEQGRHVLVEKPLAVTSADAELIVETAERAGAVCGVAMNLRFHPGILELKRLLDADLLGSVRFVQASFGYDLRLWRPESDYRSGYIARADLGGGIVLDAIHELDYLLWLLGPVDSVMAEVAHLSDLEVDVEDIALASVRFAGGPLAAIDLNFLEPVYRRTCLIVGAGAVVRWDWSTGTVALTPQGEEGSLHDASCNLADTYRSVLVDYVDAVETGREPRTPGRDGLSAVRLAEAIKSSAETGQRVSLIRRSS